MIIKRKIKKEDLNDLPKAVFPGRIFVVQTEEEAEKAVNYLLSQSILGIDSETKPSFAKGQSHKVALLQVASEECCFLFRLNHIGLPKPLIKLLESTAVVKVGLSLKDDFLMLHKRAAFKPKNIIELQQYVKEIGIEDMSLQKIYAILFNEKISKSQQLSNWETDILTDSQKLYAATDAWACLRIYSILEELKQSGNFELMPEESSVVEEETFK
ncbi:3'-5' exonuclease domain-containing protein 2 [Bacteroides sp. OttesenSCG-928-D19]|nr:3'-5' exonuclease domain-containing protein 2 [Bacteroides sp. OttesenSCG-928-N06]MDL2303974.1 3'-5' exonuclease domain-containing protein 2 [Bacteroides sp. OttesenSCG-928-D19]